jgi:uroporphyrinogen-III synthase
MCTYNSGLRTGAAIGPAAQTGGRRFTWDNVVVSRSKELEQRLERTEQQLRLLQKISRCMVRQMSLDQALEGVVTLVVDFMECDSCLLYLLDHNELVLRASNTPHPAAVGTVKLALNEGLTGWVAREKRLLSISREAYHDPRFKFFRDLPEDTYEAFLSAPVISRRGVEGVINVQHRDPHPHSGMEMELLTTVGEQVGCLLMLSRLEAQPADGTRDLVLSSGPERVRGS